ncbi:MAG: tyrosine-type recombinase/integrase, partial [Nitrososphaerales archaeon]
MSKQQTIKRTAYQNFIEPLQTEATKRAYSTGLEAFKTYMKAGNYEKLLEQGTNDNITNFIQYLKKEEKAHKTIRIYLTAIKHFYVMNDVVTINWDKVRKFVGKATTKTHDEIYTRPQIATILEKSRERERISFLLMTSAGLRIGAIPSLKVGDLTKVNSLYRIKVYAGTTSEYQTFCSPECADAIDAYLKMRRERGEEITAESPLLIQLGKKIEQVNLTGLISILNRALLDSGVRIEGDNKYNRQRIPRFHAFRKYFNTALAKAGVKPALKEVLMGHYIGLESS